MKILLAVDEHTYSEYAVRQTAKLAINTWANVTFLSVKANKKVEAQGLELADSERLRRYREIFLEYCPDEGSPYREGSFQYEMIEKESGVYELILVQRPGKKDLKLRIRFGGIAEEILNEARDEGHDLIVLGCGKGERCVWKGTLDVPSKVVNGSSCSVLVVKEDLPIQTILCCLDQSGVSQESMEMLNQLATIHGASLSLMALTREHAIRYEVDLELRRLMDYYSSRQIDTFLQLKEISELDKYLHREAKPDLLALWMGKKSILTRLLPIGWAGNTVSTSPCSALILR